MSQLLDYCGTPLKTGDLVAYVTPRQPVREPYWGSECGYVETAWHGVSKGVVLDDEPTKTGRIRLADVQTTKGHACWPIQVMKL